MNARILWFVAVLSLAALSVAGCDSDDDGTPHGQIASDISARLGEPLPTASDDQLRLFENGKEVASREFRLSDGLGPAFNAALSCSSCHERPVLGGSGGLYRNFFLAGSKLSDGSFIPAQSAGASGGVLRMYNYGADQPARPSVDETVNVIAQRNPIPFYGVGLLAELSEHEILSRADPDDEDGDGISGRPNWDRGFVGRFGRKAQTVSLEGFIRGPLFNHLGITSDPLSEQLKGRLPVDSRSKASNYQPAVAFLGRFTQAAAPEEPLTDSDGVQDPELSSSDLFALVSFAMLLAAPALEPLTEQTTRGAEVFTEVGCASCHTPRLDGPRGPLPVYSDLLLHDMGPGLADGIEMGAATGSEFRTQPLWGLAPVGPYLHDGRAETVQHAVLLHGGEAQAARDRAAALSREEFDDLIEFLMSLGGRDQYTDGLIPPGAPIAPVGEYGGPIRVLSADEQALFTRGRAVFDRDFGFQTGVGNPGFNGDSCRGCHFQPVFGGAGPRGTNVIRHGILSANGTFESASIGTMLHKQTTVLGHVILPEGAANVFEHRQPPSTFGLGLIDALPESAIIANADPDDEDGDGISGRVSWTADGRVGRLSWKAQVPSVAEFVRDAAGAELGLTLPAVQGLTFGATQDDDGIPDPELGLQDAEALAFYLITLAAPPRQGNADDPTVRRGERVFSGIGCTSCHLPSLEGPTGPVHLYSDLLLHEILPIGAPGIASGSASMREFRTSPLWGISDTGPYLHSGEADTLEEAISLHDGEGAAARDAFLGLNPAELTDLIAFLDSL